VTRRGGSPRNKYFSYVKIWLCTMCPESSPQIESGRSAGEHPLAIVLVSGGMDSCVTAAIANQEYPRRMAFLHFCYGQRTEARELEAFEKIADFYDVKLRKVVHTDYLKEIGGSSLTDERMPVPTGPSPPESIPSTYVPFRNTHILALAVSWAEVIGAERIYIGAVAEDSAGYPDCQPEYYEAYNRLIAVGTKVGGKLRIVTPVIHMTKAEIVKKGMELGAPLHLTWSCYKNTDVACGECDSCVRRRRAFHTANLPDPAAYAHPNP